MLHVYNGLLRCLKIKVQHILRFFCIPKNDCKVFGKNTMTFEMILLISSIRLFALLHIAIMTNNL